MSQPIIIYHTNDGEIKYTSQKINPTEKLDSIVVSEKFLVQELISDPSRFKIQNKKIIKKLLPPKKIKVAMIAPWGINCGIATYTQYLCKEMKTMVADLKIFAEDAKEEVIKNDGPEVIRCWKRGQDYSRIPKAIEEYNPDIIFIQHEFGNFPDAVKWNILISQLTRWRVIVIFHTVLEHNWDKKTVREDYMMRCLWEAPCPEIIVHNTLARKTLRSRGYSGRIHYIPHGCFPPTLKDRDLPVWKYNMFSTKMIFQYGFGSPHKGWDIAIDVIEKLKDKHPDVLYYASINISEFAEELQTNNFNSLMEKVKEKGLQDNVILYKGYQSDLMIRNLARCAKACIFPYKVPNKFWASWGASGAVRLPLCLSKPLVFSDFPQFTEFKGIFPICKTIDEFVEVFDKIFTDNDYALSLRKKAWQFGSERTWSKIAWWYLKCSPEKDFDALC